MSCLSEMNVKRIDFPAFILSKSSRAFPTDIRYCGAWLSTRTKPSSVMEHVARSGIPFLASWSTQWLLVGGIRAPANPAQAVSSRPEERSWKLGQQFAHLFTRENAHLRPGRQNRQACEAIFNDPDIPPSRPPGNQNNAFAFEFGVQRIAGLKTKPATQPARQNHLALGGNRSSHGKTILPNLPILRNGKNRSAFLMA